MNKFNLIKNLTLIVQGAIVGTGAILPGVSGGVLCVAFGIYKPMMELLSQPRKAFKEHYKLFIPFLIGWVLGFTMLAKVVELIFSLCAPAALMLFFGLICGTIPELIKDSELQGVGKSWTPFIASLSFSYVVFSVLEQTITSTVTPSIFSYVICGLVWGLSLIVPGLSSSSLLIYMGLYEPMTAGIAAFDFSIILPLLCGLLITVLSLARFVNRLFQKQYALISRIILGIVISSSLKIVPSKFDGVEIFLLSIACFAVGFCFVLLLSVINKKQNDKSKE